MTNMVCSWPVGIPEQDSVSTACSLMTDLKIVVVLVKNDSIGMQWIGHAEIFRVCCCHLLSWHPFYVPYYHLLGQVVNQLWVSLPVGFNHCAHILYPLALVENEYKLFYKLFSSQADNSIQKDLQWSQTDVVNARIGNLFKKHLL